MNDPSIRRAASVAVVTCSVAVLVGCGASRPAPRASAVVLRSEVGTPGTTQVDQEPLLATDGPVGAAASPSSPTADAPPVSPIGTHPLRLTDLAPPERGPVRVEIPRLNISSAVVPVGATTHGDLDVPARSDLAGWYEHAALPGQRGSIVVAAHVDLNGQRGVFFDLVESRRGDTVVITLGTTRHRYRVVSRTQVAKTDVANAGIFNTERPETLVLVTCGGQFDRAVHSYRDNVVVTAVPA